MFYYGVIIGVVLAYSALSIAYKLAQRFYFSPLSNINAIYEFSHDVCLRLNKHHIDECGLTDNEYIKTLLDNVKHEYGYYKVNVNIIKDETAESPYRFRIMFHDTRFNIVYHVFIFYYNNDYYVIYN